MEGLTLEEIIVAVGGKCLNTSPVGNISITSVSIDSRKIKKDSLYIPIKGERFDGHQFIDHAFNQGCVVALTEEKTYPKRNQILVYVKNTKTALMDLAAYYRQQFDIPVIAVTGSVGKTTTKDLIASVLSVKYKVHKTQGNFNNEIGLPLTIFELDRTHELVVLEMGMNHFGEIHHLSMVAKPNIGVITNVGVSHIENLGSKEGILRAKVELLDGISTDGIVVINGEDDLLQTIQSKHRLLTYGRNKKHDFYAEQIKIIGKDGIQAVFHTQQSTLQIMVPALGEHMIDNALAAIAVAKSLNLSDLDIQAGFKLYKPGKMRMDLQMTSNQLYIINDAYNASPDSMKTAIKVLATIPDGRRRVAILGDMFELGDYGQSLHREVGEYIGKNKEVDLLITVGSLTKSMQSQAVSAGMGQDQTYHFESQDELILHLEDLLLPEDLILVKASRGMKLEKTIDEIGKVKFK